MKRLFWIFFLFFALLILALAIWLSNLDFNRLIPAVRDQLQKNLQASIQYQNASISASFTKGFSLEIQKLSVEPLARHESQSKIEIDEVTLLFDWAPLLRRQFQIGSIELVKPKLAVRRTASGVFELEGIQMPVKKANPAPMPLWQKEAMPLAFLIDDLRASEAEIRVTDESSHAKKTFTITHLNLKVKNFSFNRPFGLTASGNLFGDQRNFEIAAQLDFPKPDRPYRLTNVNLELDLSHTDLEKAFTFFPDAPQFPFRNNPEGIFKAAADQITVNSEGIESFSAGIVWDKGKMEWVNIPEPMTNFTFKSKVTQETIAIQDLSFNLSKGSVNLAANINHWKKDPVSDLNVAISKLELENLQAHAPGEPYLKGILSLSFRGKSAGAEWKQIAPSLEGEGTIDLEEAVLVNQNMLQNILRKLSVIPGLMDRLNLELPQESRDKINRPDTPLSPIHDSFVAQNGKFQFQNLALATDTLSLTGPFSMNWENNISAQMTAKISPDFSDVLIHVVNELSLITNKNKELEIPLTLSGNLEHLSYFPDLQTIGAKIAISKLSDSISGFFKPKKGSEETPAQTETAESQPSEEPPSAEKPSKPKINLGSILQAALGGTTQPKQETTDNTPLSKTESHETVTQTPSTKKTKAPKASSVFEQLLGAALESGSDSSTEKTPS